MSRNKTQQNTKRRQSTKYPKHKDVHFRYNVFEEQVFDNYRIDNDLDNPKITKILQGIIKEFHEIKTIEKFCKEDPDLAIKMRKEKEKQYWMDFLFDHCDMREIDAIRKCCEGLLSLKHK